MKLINETKKILSNNSLLITATAVRIPVVGGHSESVNIEFNNSFEISNILKVLKKTNGVTVQDECPCLHMVKMMFLLEELEEIIPKKMH